MNKQLENNQIRFISGNIWPIKTSRKTVNIKKTDIRTYNNKLNQVTIKSFLISHPDIHQQNPDISGYPFFHHSTAEWRNNNKT